MPSFSLSLPPFFFFSLIFFLFPLPHHITFNPYNDLWIANILHFTNKANFSVSCWCCMACEGHLGWEPRSNWGLLHSHKRQSFARFSQFFFRVHPKNLTLTGLLNTTWHWLCSLSWSNAMKWIFEKQTEVSCTFPAPLAWEFMPASSTWESQKRILFKGQ